MIDLRWKSPGPVAGQFMQSMAMVQAIQGPIGGGKTSTVFMKNIQLATRQRPSPRDGVSYYKLCVVGIDYRRLWKGTIPSWWEWMPKDQGNWTGTTDGPATHVINLTLGDGRKVMLTVDFVGIGDNKAEDVLRGYQPTAFLLNEADLLAEDVFTYCLGRAGRYPRALDGGPSWRGVMMDFNAPEADSWVERRVVHADLDEQVVKIIEEALAEARLEGSQVDGIVEYFCQPGGLDPNAENLENLPPKYYELQMAGQPQWYIDRMIHNKTGFSRDHKVIWPEYNDRIHCASASIEPVRGLPISIGVDAGGTPAGTVGQTMPNGQHRVLAEITTDPNSFTGPKNFAQAFNRLLKERFEGFKISHATGDPSSAFGGDEEDVFWLRTVSDVMEVHFRPASTNALAPRFEVIRRPLTQLIDGDQPAYVISPDCKVLRRGLANKYRFRKRQIQGVNAYQDKVDKTDESHVCEAEQYRMLGCSDYSAVLGRGIERARSGVRQSHYITDDTSPQEVQRLLRDMNGGDHL